MFGGETKKKPIEYVRGGKGGRWSWKDGLNRRDKSHYATFANLLVLCFDRPEVSERWVQELFLFWIHAEKAYICTARHEAGRLKLENERALALRKLGRHILRGSGRHACKFCATFLQKFHRQRNILHATPKDNGHIRIRLACGYGAQPFNAF